LTLFGSKARGDDRPDSDRDICVIVDRFEKEWIDAPMAVRDTLRSAMDGPFDFRYPFSPEISESQAHAAISAADRILAAVKAILG
jgi:predicted nucleotidyltransferase